MEPIPQIFRYMCVSCPEAHILPTHTSLAKGSPRWASEPPAVLTTPTLPKVWPQKIHSSQNAFMTTGKCSASLCLAVGLFVTPGLLPVCEHCERHSKAAVVWSFQVCLKPDLSLWLFVYSISYWFSHLQEPNDNHLSRADEGLGSLRVRQPGKDSVWEKRRQETVVPHKQQLHYCQKFHGK